MQKENQLKSCGKKMLSSREVVARDLPHPTMLSLLNRKQQPYFMREAEDPGILRAAKLSEMTPNFMGFTLIELLVVVLIIGILAAVALPQYQKAVEKSKAAQAQTLLKSVYQAAKAYEMANGTWPASFDELAVDVPWTGTTRVSNQACISDVRSNADWSLQICNGKGNSPALYMSRLSGEYATEVQFNMYFGNQTYVPTDEIICSEKNIATKPIGYYCEKILRGTVKYNGSTHREYVLP